MKHVLLLRHAKSDWDDRTLPDFDRPLAKRGVKDAPLIGAVLASFDSVPGLILASPARRAKETAKLVAQACDYQKAIDWHKSFYEGDSSDLVAAIQRLPDSVECVLLVGHNPTMEETVSVLISGDEAEFSLRMPTAALVCLQFDLITWTDLEPGEGILQWFLTPKLIQAIQGET